VSGPKISESVEEAFEQGFVVTRGLDAGDWGSLYWHLCCMRNLPSIQVKLYGTYVYLSANTDTADYDVPLAYQEVLREGLARETGERQTVSNRRVYVRVPPDQAMRLAANVSRLVHEAWAATKAA
jgi:hypothetical protein